jgi:hypothetical protein
MNTTRQFRGRLSHEALRARLAGEAAPASAVASSGAASLPAAAENATPQPGSDQETIQQWLTQVHLLKGVPFNYLVPDISMLPAESIRFFQVDNNWIEALLDGAYSIGFAGVAQGVSGEARSGFMQVAARRARSGLTRRLALAQARPRTAAPLPSAQPAPGDASSPTPEVLSGFLLRSAVVAGWPGLQAFGYSDVAATQPLQIVRMELVAPSLLLCLFAGVLARVDLQEPSEALHFGLDGSSGAWEKNLRYANGTTSTSVGSFTGSNVPVNLRGSGTPAIVPMDALAQAMSNQVWTTPPPGDTAFTAAQFGLEMVEGVQVVSFQLQTTT